MKNILTLLAGIVLLLLVSLALATALLGEDWRAQVPTDALPTPQAQDKTLPSTSTTPISRNLIESSDFDVDRVRQGSSGELGHVTAAKESRHITIEGAEGDRVVVARFRSAGIPTEEVSSFLQLPRDVRLARWEIAVPLLKAISEDKRGASEIKRKFALVAASKGQVMRMTYPEAQATEIFSSDPTRYAIDRDGRDGSVYLVDLTTCRFDSQTVTRIDRVEARLARNRQDLLQVIRGE